MVLKSQALPLYSLCPQSRVGKSGLESHQVHGWLRKRKEKQSHRNWIAKCFIGLPLYVCFHWQIGKTGNICKRASWSALFMRTGNFLFQSKYNSLENPGICVAKLPPILTGMAKLGYDLMLCRADDLDLIKVSTRKTFAKAVSCHFHGHFMPFPYPSLQMSAPCCLLWRIFLYSSLSCSLTD